MSSLSSALKPLLSSPATGVIVTGGASGLGLASARALAAVGRPLSVWDINEAKALAAAAELRAEHGVASIGIGMDIADPAGYANAIARSREAMGSIGGTLGNAVNPIYTAAKGGVLSLVRSLADRLGHDGIRINSISPGQILTPMLQPSVDALPKGFYEKRILLGRMGVPEEIGRVVRFLLSDEASYITAAEFVVDGGNISSQRS